MYDDKLKTMKRMGNATECALLGMAEANGYDYNHYRSKDKEVLTIPFDSKRKRMTTVYRTDDPTQLIVYVKGAPDLLLPSCGAIFGDQGKAQALDEGGRDRLKSGLLLRNATLGYRSLLLAYKMVAAYGFNVADYEGEEKLLELESELIILGVVGIEDPLRDGVPKAVQTCHRAGITVRMVTGDDIEYAKSIAIKSGIISADEINPESENYRKYTCMMGAEFAKLIGGLEKVPDPEDPENPEKKKDKVRNTEMFNEIIKDLRVLARSQPEHKYMLVTGLKEDENNVVAVTGDGTNDAPALKKADIGFAMGLAGTEIAKEASKIILLDDNFGSIITALKWGRNIYLSIRKFLQFQLTINIVALTVCVVAGVSHMKEPPINAIQMLWVNLIMDTFAALALATEPPSEKLLLERPYGKNESILTRAMWRNIVCGAIYEIAILMIILFARPWFFFYFDTDDANNHYNCLDEPEPEKDDPVYHECVKHVNTMVFHTFVMMQVFNEICCRRIKSSEFFVFEQFFNNWRFIVILLLTVAVQILLVQTGAKGINTYALTWEQHLVCLLLSVNVMTWVLFCKLVVPEGIFAFVKLDERVSSLLTL